MYYGLDFALYVNNLLVCFVIRIDLALTHAEGASPSIDEEVREVLRMEEDMVLGEDMGETAGEDMGETEGDWTEIDLRRVIEERAAVGRKKRRMRERKQLIKRKKEEDQKRQKRGK